MHDLHAVRVEVDRGADDSTTSVTHFIDTHSRYSGSSPSHAGRSRDIPARSTGYSTGMPQAFRMCSLWCASGRRLGRVVVAGQHQHAAVAGVPAMLACLKTSPQRSTPGPLPYHMPNTPSYSALFEQVDLLRAPDGGGGQVFVDARMEHARAARRDASSPSTRSGRRCPAANRDSRR
jgi:hypothetical protein